MTLTNLTEAQEAKLQDRYVVGAPNANTGELSHYGNYPTDTSNGLALAERKAREIAAVTGYAEVLLNGTTIYLAG